MYFIFNATVRVKLTDRGRKILEEQSAEFKRTTGRDDIKIQEDKEGWSSWTFWMLMNTFGHSLNGLQEEPFHCNIQISDSDLFDKI